MATAKRAFVLAPSLFDSLPPAKKAMNNPIFVNVAGVLVYRVRKNDDEPASPLMHYWYSLQPDNSQPVDVRSLTGYDEPEYERQGDAQASSDRWVKQLADEAERVIRLALANGTFLSKISRFD